MTSEPTILERVIHIADHYSANPVHASTSMIDLGDDLVRHEVVLHVEDELDFECSDAEFEQLVTVADLALLVIRKSGEA